MKFRFVFYLRKEMRLFADFFNLIEILILMLILNISVFSFNESAINRHFYSLQHNQLNNENLEKVLSELQINWDEQTRKSWKKLLNKAHWHQDIFHFFGSRHHFDNCCFEDGINQINNLQKDNDADYAKLTQIQKEKDRKRLKEKIIFRMGRILHSAQDFFSHSNYVEIMQNEFEEIEEVPAVEFLSETGQKRILELSKNGLFSERFFISFPHKCDKNKMGKQSFNKDGPKHEAGKKLTRWQNQKNNNLFTSFEAAMFFADKSTYLIFYKIFSGYPLLTKEFLPQK